MGEFMSVELEKDIKPKSDVKIKVIGIGGGGGNAIKSMINLGLEDVDFIAVNTDSRSLKSNTAPTKIQIGKETTKGQGAGAKPEVGKKSIEENIEEVRQALSGSDIIFITAGMGGGTGTGAAPIAAKIGREIGALVIGVVTKPFDKEGQDRMNVAEKGIESLREYVDSILVISNQKLISITDRNTSLLEAYQKVDRVLYNAISGITDIITKDGFVHIDLADLCTIMKGKGDTLMGTGVAVGENRAIEATQKALNSPLLESVTIDGAQGILVNITAPENMGFFEHEDAISLIKEKVSDDVKLIYGIVFTDKDDSEFKVTVIATGFKKNQKTEPQKDQTYKPQNNEDLNNKPQRVPTSINTPIVINTNFSEKKTSFRQDSPIKVPPGLKDIAESNKPAYFRQKNNLDSKMEETQRLEFGNLETDKVDEAKTTTQVIDGFRERFTNLNNNEKNKDIEKPAILRRTRD